MKSTENGRKTKKCYKDDFRMIDIIMLVDEAKKVFKLTTTEASLLMVELSNREKYPSIRALRDGSYEDMEDIIARSKLLVNSLKGEYDGR